MNLQEAAEEYLKVKAEMKNLKKRLEDASKVLDSNLSHGDTVMANGVLHTWTISVALTTKWKEALLAAQALLKPSDSAIVDEAINQNGSKRTTKTLSPAKG